jgi:hypothetical protein
MHLTRLTTSISRSSSDDFVPGVFAPPFRVKSAAAYKDLLPLWKDADPDIPVVQQAKTEYVRGS